MKDYAILRITFFLVLIALFILGAHAGRCDHCKPLSGSKPCMYYEYNKGGASCLLPTFDANGKVLPFQSLACFENGNLCNPR